MSEQSLLIPPGMASLIHSLGAVWVAALFGVSLAALVTAVAVSPPVRTWVTAVGWRLFLARRVRRACVEAGVVTRKGRTPIVVATGREPYGVSVRLWCRAGTSGEDIDRQRALFRTACYAADLRVVTDYRHPQIVTLEVVLPPVAVVPWTSQWR